MSVFLDATVQPTVIELATGQTFATSWNIQDNGTAVDFTGATITAKITPNIDGTGTAIATFTVASNAAGDALTSDGNVHISLTKAQVDDITVPEGAQRRRFLGYLAVCATYSDGSGDALILGDAFITVGC